MPTGSNPPGDGNDGSPIEDGNTVLTPNWVEIPCRYQYVSSGGSAVTGRLEITPVGANRWNDDLASIPVGIVATRRVVTVVPAVLEITDALGNPVNVDAGVAYFSLPNTDFAGGGWLWRIREIFDDKKAKASTYMIEAPLSFLETGIDISRALPQEPPTGVPATLVTREEFDYWITKLKELLGLSQGDGDIVRTTFDDAEDGLKLVQAGDIQDVVGSPWTTAGASLHPGGLGVSLDGTTGHWGHWAMPNLNATASDLQFYIRLDVVGGGPADVVEFQSDATGSVGMGGIVLKTGKVLGISDSDGQIAEGGLMTTPLPIGQKVRVDVRSEHDGFNQVVTVRLFKSNPEAISPDETIQVSFPSNSPDRYKFGTGSGSSDWSFAIDTIGRKPGVEKYIPPFVEVAQNWLHEYEAGNDRTLQAGDLGAEDAISTLNVQALIAAKKHGDRGIRTTAGYIEYPIRNPDGETHSIYVRPSATHGAAATPIVSFMNSGVLVAAICQKTALAVGLMDGAQALHGQTTHSGTNAKYSRIDYGWNWSSAAGGTLVLRAIYYYDPTEEGEGSVHDPVLTYTFTGVARPTAVRLGYTGTGWVGDFDTHRVNPNSTDETSWSGIEPPQVADVVYSATEVGRTSAKIIAKVDGYASINLGRSLTADGSGTPTGTVTYSGSQAPDAHGMVVFNVTGLTANTDYHFKLSPDGAGTFVGDHMLVKTYPADSTAFTRKIVISSCQMGAANEPAVAGSPLELSYKEMLTAGIHERWDLGDWGYWGSSNRPTDAPWDISQRWVNQTSGLPNLRKVLALFPHRIQKDDHEVGPKNPDPSVDPAKTAIEKLHNLEAGLPKIMPTYPLAASTQTDSFGTFKRHLGGTFNISNRVRVVMLDAYAMGRTSPMANDVSGGFGSASSGTTKSFLGVDQDTWLEDLLTTGTQPALTIFVCGKSFLGRSTANPPNNNTDYDKIWIYTKWREWFGALVDANLPGATWVGGDRHFNAYAPASMNPWSDKMSCWISSGLSMHNLSPQNGENGTVGGATEGYTKVDGTWKLGVGNNFEKTVMQYITFTLSDNNTGAITFKGDSRYLQNTWDGSGGKAGESLKWADWLSTGLTDGFTQTDTFTYTP